MQKELDKKIIELAKEMVSQDNLATQYPLYVVRQKVKVYGESGWCNEVERKEDGDGELCERCEKLQEENDDLPEFCDDCDDSLFVHFNWEDQTVDEAGSFFTAKAAREHIEANHYHYNKPFVFCTGAWRNYEIQEMMRFIIEYAGLEIPSQYK